MEQDGQTKTSATLSYKQLFFLSRHKIFYYAHGVAVGRHCESGGQGDESSALV